MSSSQFLALMAAAREDEAMDAGAIADAPPAGLIGRRTVVFKCFRAARSANAKFARSCPVLELANRFDAVVVTE